MSSLTSQQESALQLFMQRLNELLESSIVQSKKTKVGGMDETVFGEKPATAVVFDGHKKEDFLAFFSTFRQFTMEKEQAVYFKDVCKIVLAHCDREELKDWVNFALKRWDKLLDSMPGIQFVLDGESYTNRKLLKLWLYSGRFHTDIDKADRWNSLPEMARNDAELSLQALVPKLVNCLVIVGSVIRWWREATTEAVPAAPTT